MPDLSSLITTLLELRNKSSAKILPDQSGGYDKLVAHRPGKLPSALHQLAPLWQQHRSEIIRVVSNFEGIESRCVKLPYHPQQVETFLDAADKFFNADRS